MLAGGKSELGERVVSEVRRTLRRVREDPSSEVDPAFRHIVAAISASRADLRRRPKRGAVYSKMVAELEAPHVVLSRMPRRSSVSVGATRALRTPAPTYDYSVRAVESPPPVPGFFRTASLNRGTTEVSRSAAMARSMIKVFVPRFLVALLDLEDCAQTRLAAARPELFVVSGDFLVMPNPAYFDPEAFAADPKLAAREAERSRKGFGLVCWWIHPTLKKRRFFVAHSDLKFRRRRAATRLDDASADRRPAVAVSDLLDSAADADTYLYDVSDLRHRDRAGLARLERDLASHLSAVYGVRSRPHLYFHRQHTMWNSPDRTWSMTLHLHVAVARARTPSCYSHSVDLADVLDRLALPPPPPLARVSTPPYLHPPTPTETARLRLIIDPRDRDRSDDLPSPNPAADDLPAFELLNLPVDPLEADKTRRLLADSGFLISAPLSAADLAFNDLLGYQP